MVHFLASLLLWSGLPLGLFSFKFGFAYLVELCKAYPAPFAVGGLFGLCVSLYATHMLHLCFSLPKYKERRSMVWMSGLVSTLVLLGVFYFWGDQGTLNGAAGSGLVGIFAGMMAGSMAYWGYRCMGGSCKA